MSIDSRQTASDDSRVTVLLLAYNQASTVESAARSVLDQDCEPIEIILSDDASTDDTFGILQRIADAYCGPHHVRARRNPQNVGIGEHYNILVREASGQLLVTAAGDDISEPRRVRAIIDAWRANGRRVDLIASNLRDLDRQGNIGATIEVDDLRDWQGVNDWCRRRPYVVGAAHAFTRRLWDRFGPLHREIVYEDQIITLRALMAGGALTIRHALVQYRQGGASALHSFEDGATFVSRTRLLHARSAAEHRQQIADANIEGCGDEVKYALQSFMSRDALVIALLDAEGDFSALKLALTTPVATLSWRLRRWWYLRWPDAGALIRRMQYRSKELRKRRKRAHLPYANTGEHQP